MQGWDTLVKSAASLSQQVSTKAIFNSLLWILPLPIVALIILSFSTNTTAQYFFMGLIGLVVLVVVVWFTVILVLALRGRPELIQLIRSEDHIYKMAALEKLGDQNHTIATVDEVEGSNNPNESNPSDAGIPNPEDISSLEEADHE